MVAIAGIRPLFRSIAIVTIMLTFLNAPGQHLSPDPFHDPLVHLELLPRHGNKIVVFVFEDLACPACAKANPYIVKAVRANHVSLVQYDFPLPSHVWAFHAAVTARYLQNEVSSVLGDEYREDVFASQELIATEDDLTSFSRKWFSSHRLQMPEELDPSGRYAHTVAADVNLGKSIGLRRTPTIIIATPNEWKQVLNAATLEDVLSRIVGGRD